MISVISPTSFDEFRRAGQPCIAVKIESVRCVARGPSSPAPHPHNDTPQPNWPVGLAEQCISNQNSRMCACVFVTFEIFEPHPYEVCGYAFSYREGPYYIEGASTCFACTPLP